MRPYILALLSLVLLGCFLGLLRSRSRAGLLWCVSKNGLIFWRYFTQDVDVAERL